jgi:CubicO group peptidase (beta-lactamase class C family)
MEFWSLFLLLFVVLTVNDKIAVDCDGIGSKNDAERRGQRSTLRNLEDVRPEIDDFVRKVMTAGRIPGLSLVVVNGDMDTLTSGYGVMNIDRGDSVDVNSLFMIGSTTKAMTAALLLQILREHK